MYIKVDKESYEAVIITTNLKIIGMIHTLPQERLTDFMAESTQSYLPVTDAAVYKLSDDSLIFKTRFLSLNRNEVTAIFLEADVMK